MKNLDARDPAGSSEEVELSPSGSIDVSVIVPMLNESDHVGSLVQDLVAQDYEGQMEIIVADGGSKDGSVEKIKMAAEAVGLDLLVIENPAQWVSAGLNACIRRARGDVILRLDCHARYLPDYIRRSIEASVETGAWNIGPLVVPHGRSPTERAVACAMDSPFGGVVWSRHGTERRRIDVDTVYLGAYRREALHRVGLFDDALKSSEDEEMNLRLRDAGGRVVLDTSIRTLYIPQGSHSSVFRQYYCYGFWKVPVMLKHRRVFGARSLMPIAFVTSLAVLGPAGAMMRTPRRLLAVELATYVGLAAYFGARSIARRNEAWRLLPHTLGVFPAFHVGYGVGMFHGLLQAARREARTSDTTREPRT